MRAARPPLVLRSGWQRTLAVLALAGALLAAVGMQNELARVATAGRDAAVFAAAPVCREPVPLLIPGCITEVTGTVTGRSASGSRSPTYGLTMRFDDGATFGAADVGSSMYGAVAVGSPVVAFLWRGNVTAVSTLTPPAVGATTASDPRRVERETQAGCVILGAAAPLLAAWSVLTVRRLRRRSAPLPQLSVAPRRYTRLPTLGSRIFVVALVALTAGPCIGVFLGVDGASPVFGSALIGALATGALTVLLILVVPARAIEVDSAGISFLSGAAVRRRTPWSRVVGLRTVNRGRSSVVRLVLWDGVDERVMSMRRCTAANEELFAYLIAHDERMRRPGG